MDRRRRVRGVQVASLGFVVVMVAAMSIPPGGATNRAVSQEVAGSESISPSEAQEALSYWTQERMSNAAPMEMRSSGGPAARAVPAPVETGSNAGDRPLSGGGGAETIATAEDFWQASSSVMPARAVGRLFFRSWDSLGQRFFDSSCSATVIEADNRSTVWTAGHCVFSTHENIWHQSFLFCPGYRDRGGRPQQSRDCPLGKWVPEWVATTPQWIDARCTPDGSCSVAEFGGDFGALTMYPRRGQLIENRASSHVLRYNITVGDHTLFGYPAVPSSFYPFDGRFLYWCTATNSFVENTLKMPCHATAGASGGPWLGPWNRLGRAYLDTVNSHGGGETGYLSGPYQGQWAYDLYELMRRN